jgi:hypothetical protein
MLKKNDQSEADDEDQNKSFQTLQPSMRVWLHVDHLVGLKTFGSSTFPRLSVPSTTLDESREAAISS